MLNVFGRDFHVAEITILRYVNPAPMPLKCPRSCLLQILRCPCRFFEIQTAQGTPISDSLGTAPVCYMKPAEIVEVAGSGHLFLPNLLLL